MKLFNDSHPLAGNLDKRSPWEIRQALFTRPPTRDQLDELASEELTGRDRSEVYRIFAQVKVR